MSPDNMPIDTIRYPTHKICNNNLLIKIYNLLLNKTII